MSKGGSVMRNLTNLVMGVLLAAMMLVFVTKTSMAQDVMKVAPESHKVLLENDRVRVLEYRIKPGKKDATHSHKTFDRELKADEVLFFEAKTHAHENVGSTEAHGLLIELK